MKDGELDLWFIGLMLMMWTWHCEKEGEDGSLGKFVTHISDASMQPGLDGIVEFILKLSLPELRWAMKYKVCKSDESWGARISTIELGRGVPIAPQSWERIPKFPVGSCWCWFLSPHSRGPRQRQSLILEPCSFRSPSTLSCYFIFYLGISPSQSVFHWICSVLDLQIQ